MNQDLCRTISHNTELKSIIKYMSPAMNVCVVRPDPELIIRGESMVWPAIIFVNNELQSEAALKELGKYCVEVEVAVKFQNRVSKEDREKHLVHLCHTTNKRANGVQRNRILQRPIHYLMAQRV